MSILTIVILFAFSLCDKSIKPLINDFNKFEKAFSRY